jgi:CSLREA domain-containing protein
VNVSTALSRRWAVLVALAIAGALLPAVVVSPPAARAALTTLAVTKTADTNDGACTPRDCSLREAIFAANGLADAEIDLPAGTFRLSIPGRDEDQNATGDLDIRAGTTIRGKGARKTIIDGRGVDRLFHVPPQGPTPFTVSIAGVTITGGDPGIATGGGILHEGQDARLILTNSAVHGNRATAGGGIHNQISAMTISRSTISGNKAPNGEGGGILNSANLRIENSTVSGNRSATGGGIMFEAGPMTIIHSTVAFNTAPAGGGGIAIEGSPLTFFDSIVAKNESDVAGQENCSKPVSGIGNNLENGTSCGFNLPAADPKLGPLQDNGGPTDTHALGKRSPAIDAAGSGVGLETDQRGVDRPQGRANDIGAVELQRRRRR